MEITQNTILKLIVRQGSDDDRKKVILTSGEPGYTTDTKRLFIGDGFTTGGILAGNVFQGFTADLSLLDPAEIGDYAFNTDTNKFYILSVNDGSSVNDWYPVAGIYTGSTFITVNSNNRIILKPLSAGIYDPDSAGTGLYVDINGRLAVTPSTFTFNNGLSANVNGTNVSGQPISPLSGNVLVGFNNPDVLAKYNGTGNNVEYSRNLVSVNKVGVGNYDFNYSIPTSNAYPSIEFFGTGFEDIHAKITAVSNTTCNVHILSSDNSNVDATIFFRLTY